MTRSPDDDLDYKDSPKSRWVVLGAFDHAEIEALKEKLHSSQCYEAILVRYDLKRHLEMSVKQTVTPPV